MGEFQHRLETFGRAVTNPRCWDKAPYLTTKDVHRRGDCVGLCRVAACFCR